MKKLGNILYKAAMFTLNVCVLAAIIGGVTGEVTVDLFVFRAHAAHDIPETRGVIEFP